MEYYASMLFMLISSKGNFTAYYVVFNYLTDVVLIYIGITKNRFRPSDFKLLAKIGGIYLAYIIFRYIFVNDLTFEYFISDCNFFVERIIMSFLFCAVLREKAVYYIIKITIQLSVVSLIFFTMQIISGDFVSYIGRIINLPPRVGNPGYTNIIFFTYDYINHPFQNAGFSWEPGAFGDFLDVGILMHFLINGFKFDKGAWILTAAIITTQSTTTYACFAVVILLFLRVNGLKLTTLLLFAVPMMCIVATQVPFLVDKIGKTWEEDQFNLNEMISLTAWYQKNGGQLHLNRFGSFIYIYNYFGPYKLFWGISNRYQDVMPAGDVMNISNGDIDFMAKFGMVGTGFLLYRFVLFVRKFLFKAEYSVYCVLILLVLGFGEPLFMFNTTLCLLFFSQYADPKDFFTKREERELLGYEPEEHEPAYN